MLVGLIIMVPVLLLVGVTIWAVYRCRRQQQAYFARPTHPAVKVEHYRPEGEAQTGRPQAARSCLEVLDSYFSRSPTILSGHGGGWGLTRHLTRVPRHHQHPVGSFHDRQENW